MIEESTINEIRARANIVDVVSSRIPNLKRSGKNHHACCPFHQEKSPSFTVEENKQFYYCFGCGASGDAIGFVIAYDGLTFPNAVKLLSEQYGIIESRTVQKVIPKQVKEQLYEDKMVIAIYDSDIKNGITHSYQDTQRIKLARSRVEGIKRKWNLQ